MGLLTIKEDRPTPKAVYNWRVYTCASIASFAACMIGYDSAFIGGTIALDSFRADFGLVDLSDSARALISANIVSVYQAGAFFGSFGAYVSSHFLGRRWSLILFSLIFCLGAGLMCGISPDRGLTLIYPGRFLAGVGVGGCSNMTPIYISELSPPSIRGRLVGIYELGWQMGGLVGFWINYGVSRTMEQSSTQWLIPIVVQLIPAGMLLVGAFFIPESPRWLFANGKRERAMKNLCWMRNLEPTDTYIIEEVSYVDEDIERFRREVGAGFWKPFQALKQKRIQHRFFIGGMLFLWQNGSGINAVNYYSPTVFRSLGIRGTNAGLFTTGIFGVVKTVLTFVWIAILVDHLGRRTMLLIGAIGGSLCFWYVGGYIAVADPVNNASEGLTSGGISAIFFFYLWTAFYTPSWNGTPWVINSEMYDQNTRSLGQAWAAANNWFWNFIISRFTPQMFVAWGYGVYFFFASLMILSVIFIWYLVPETKGLPLEVMDRLFEVKPTRKAHKIVMDELHDNYRAPDDEANLAEKAGVIEEREAKQASSNSSARQV